MKNDKGVTNVDGIRDLEQRIQALDLERARLDKRKGRLLQAIKKRLGAGGTTGDPLQDLVVAQYGVLGGAGLERLRELARKVESNAGQLLLITRMSSTQVKSEGCFPGPFSTHNYFWELCRLITGGIIVGREKNQHGLYIWHLVFPSTACVYCRGDDNWNKLGSSRFEIHRLNGTISFYPPTDWFRGANPTNFLHHSSADEKVVVGDKEVAEFMSQQLDLEVPKNLLEQMVAALA